MNRLLIEDMIDVAKAMYDMIKNGCEDICFIGKYDDAAMLIKELLMVYDETHIQQVSIESIDWDGYDKEYIVTLDHDFNVWCEKAYQEEHKRYLIIGENCVLIADDCNSKILDNIESDVIYEVGYDIDEDEAGCDENCENCKCHNVLNNHEEVTRVAVDSDGKLKGFEKSWESNKDGLTYKTFYSYYSNNESMLKNMLENFNIKY